MVIDYDYHRDLREGTVLPPESALTFMVSEYGDIYSANYAASDMASRFNDPWRRRYPSASESPIWVVNIPGGYALVPNSLYSPNMPWKDALAYLAAKMESVS